MELADVKKALRGKAIFGMAVMVEWVELYRTSIFDTEVGTYVYRGYFNKEQLIELIPDRT